MSKMSPKFLLTNFTVVRNGARRTLPGNAPAMLTKGEIELLDRLTAKTGREHYREVKNEMPVTFDDDDGGDGGLDLGGIAERVGTSERADTAKLSDGSSGSEPDDDDDDAEDGPDIDSMTVKELKAYLDAEPAVEYAASADKATLVGLAHVKKASGDPDGGL